ncbi:transposase domain-containing protein [Photobacterium alginatilyticum]|uniref:transposase domain-containing protein n=1 Tax=Photobacterium alginatilyticum TaxID=1775171 RepID=UPI0040683C97
MSEFSKELQITAEFYQGHHIDAFSKHIPFEWVEEAVKQTKQASVRKRRFPAEQAVWLVLGIRLLRNRSIQSVCDKHVLAFPDSKGELPPPATSSLVKRKEKLGTKPMQWTKYSLAHSQRASSSSFKSIGASMRCYRLLI